MAIYLNNVIYMEQIAAVTRYFTKILADLEKVEGMGLSKPRQRNMLERMTCKPQFSTKNRAKEALQGTPRY